MAQGILYIVSAPSGAGKTSLLQALIQQIKQLRVSISHTTRQPRAGEQAGVDYHFVSKAHFEHLKGQNVFLEYAQVFDYHYGTCGQWVNEQLDQGMDVVLEIDWQGARQIRHHMPQAVSIFILPPSLDALQDRLSRRAQDNVKTIEKRMHAALDEISHYNEYDYLIINDDFDDALLQFKSIITSKRLTQARQQKTHKTLLDTMHTQSPKQSPKQSPEQA